jgi:hypothetical protein
MPPKTGKTPVRNAAHPAGENDTDTVPVDPAVEQAVDELEAFINRSMTDVGRQQEKVADRVFAVLYDGDVAAALAARAGNQPKYDALVRRSGKTLLMDATTLSRCVRVGALNHRLSSGRWPGLGWQHKVELLPLLGPEQNFERLARGIAFALKPGATRDGIREWVAAQRRPEGEENDTRERKAPTPTKALKMFDIGTQLQRVAERRDLAARVRRMKAADQREWMAALERVLKSLGRLQEELTDTGED